MAYYRLHVCQVKTAYASLQEAQDSALWISKSTGYVMVGYRCPVCTSFHVGGKSVLGYRKRAFNFPKEREKPSKKPEKKSSIRGMEEVLKKYHK